MSITIFNIPGKPLVNAADCARARAIVYHKDSERYWREMETQAVLLGQWSFASECRRMQWYYEGGNV